MDVPPYPVGPLCRTVGVWEGLFAEKAHKNPKIKNPPQPEGFFMETQQFKQQYSTDQLPEMGGTTMFHRSAKVKLPSDFGVFTLYSYENGSGQVHLAIVKGEVSNQADVLLRVHSSCVTGDVLGSQRCDCRHQLIKALEVIEKNNSGIVIYAFQEGRGIGLINKLRAYYLQERGFDTVEANLALGFPEDLRDYAFVRDILDDLGVVSIALLTNNPNKIEQLQHYGVTITRRVNHEIPACPNNHHYLETKKVRMGHLLTTT